MDWGAAWGPPTVHDFGRFGSLEDVCRRQGYHCRIIAVPGLAGTPRWEWTSYSPDIRRACDWLGDIFPRSISYSLIQKYHYNLLPDSIGGFLSAEGLTQAAERLLELIVATKKGEKLVPLVFVAHDLGGIVVKKALLLARSNEKYRQISQACRRIIFFGTPHRAPDEASWEDALLSIVLASPAKLHIVPGMATRISRLAPFLEELSETFLLSATECRFVNIYQQRHGSLKDQPAVHPYAATMGVVHETILPRNVKHNDLPAFTSGDDPVFRHIVDVVKAECNPVYRACLDRLAQNWPPVELFPSRHDVYRRFLEVTQWDRLKNGSRPEALQVLDERLSANRNLFALGEHAFDARCLFQCLRSSGNRVVYFSPSGPDSRLRSPDAFWGLALLQLLSQAPHLLPLVSGPSTAIELTDTWTLGNTAMLLRRLLTSKAPTDHQYIGTPMPVYILVENMPIHTPQWKSTLDHLNALQATHTDRKDASGKETRNLGVPAINLILLFDKDNVTETRSIPEIKVLDPHVVYNSMELLEQFASSVVATIPRHAANIEQDPSHNKALVLKCGYDAQQISLLLLLAEHWQTLPVAQQHGGDTWAETLKKHFDKKVDRIFSSLDDWARIAIGWLVYAKRPLNQDELLAGIQLSHSLPGSPAHGLRPQGVRASIKHALGSLVYATSQRICFASSAVQGSFKTLVEKKRTEELRNRASPSKRETEAGYQAVPNDVDIAATLLLCISGTQRVADHPDAYSALKSYAVEFWRNHLLDGAKQCSGQRHKHAASSSDYTKVTRLAKDPRCYSAWQELDNATYWSKSRWKKALHMEGRLVFAAQVGLDDVVSGLSPDSELGGEIEDAICAATRYDNVKIVDILLSHKPNRESAALIAALDIASLRNCIPITERLLKLTKETKERSRLLRHLTCQAAKLGYEDQLKLLAAHGAQLNEPSHGDERPLKYAARYGFIGIVKYLVAEKGVPVFSHDNLDHRSSEDDTNEDALYLSARNGHTEIVDFLLDRVVVRIPDSDLVLTQAEGPRAHNDDTITTDRPPQVSFATWPMIEEAMGIACRGMHARTAKHILNHKTVRYFPQRYRPVNGRLLRHAMQAETRPGHTPLALRILESATIPPEGNADLLDSFVYAAELGQVDFVRHCLRSSQAPGIAALVTGAASSGRMALHAAASSGHTEIVSLLLERGAEVNAVERLSQTPLSLAVVAGHAKTVRLLLKAGADVHMVGVTRQSILALAALSSSCDRNVDVIRLLFEFGSSFSELDRVQGLALHLAARRGHINILEEFLSQPDVDVNVRGERDKNALHFSAQCTARTAVKAAEMLITAGVSTKETDAAGWLPVHIAATHGSADLMSLFFHKDQEILKHRTARGDTILHLAYKNFETLIWAINHGCDVNATNNKGATALMNAASHSQVDTSVGLLLASGARADLFDDANQSALFLAVEAANDAAAEMLLRADPSVLFQLDSQGCSALYLAIHRGATDTAIKLLVALKEHSTANNSRNALLKVINSVSVKTRMTPLLLAASKNLSPVVERIVQLKPGLEQRGRSGLTALMYAIENRNESMAELLLKAQKQARKSPHSVDHGMPTAGKARRDISVYPTPLIFAARNGNINMVKLLLNHTVDVNEPGGQHNTALTAAAAGGFDEVVALLLKNRADVTLPGGTLPNALAAAVYSTSATAVDRLLDQDHQSVLVQDSQGRNALHISVQVGFWYAFEKLLAVVEELEKTRPGTLASAVEPDKQGRTLLHFAAGCSVPDMLLGLLAHPLFKFADDIDVADRDGWTALHWACRIEDGSAVLQCLLEKGADPSLETPDGWTPLNIAQYHGATDNETAISEALQSRAARLAEETGGMVEDHMPRMPTQDGMHLLVEEVSWGVGCDGCLFSNLNGACFKCNDCEDFDYCFKCHWSAADTHFKGHTWTVRENRADPKGNRRPPYEKIDAEDATDKDENEDENEDASDEGGP